MYDRGARIWSGVEHDCGFPDLRLTIPKFDDIDVPLKVDGHSFDENGLARIKDSAIDRSRNGEARFGGRIVNDQDGRVGMVGINSKRLAGDWAADQETIENAGEGQFRCLRADYPGWR
jgi:hypothetical protein